MKKRLVVAVAALVLALGGTLARAGVAAAEGTVTPTTLYVDSATGSDSFDCTASTVTDDGPTGPCKTIAGALSWLGQSGVSFGDGEETVDYTSVNEISVATGTYQENNPLSIDLSTAGATDSLLILGQGAGSTIVEPTSAGQSLFDTSGTDVSVELDDMTLQGSTALDPDDGPDAGGAVDNSASNGGDPGLILLSDQISGYGVSENGGAIYNSPAGVIEINRTTISGNTSGLDGGGLFNAGVMTLNDSTVSGNDTETGSGANGGGIASEEIVDPTPSLTVDGSTVSDNTADGGGGGIHTDESILNVGNFVEPPALRPDAEPPIPTTISGNTATTGTGGGIWASDNGDDSADMTIDDATIDDNSALSSDGGGIWIEATGGDQPTISDDVISGNTAPAGDGGGVWTSDDQEEDAALLSDDVIGSGAAPSLPTCPAGASASTNAPNSALKGGGVYNAPDDGSQGQAILSSVTVDGNCATGDSDDGGGGGIYTGYSGLSLAQSTVADNESINGGEGGGLLSDNDDEVEMWDSTVAANEVVGADGGGIESSNDSSLYLYFSTIIDNEAVSEGDAAAVGGGVDIANDLSEEAVPSEQPDIPSGDTLDNCTAPIGDDEGANLEDDAPLGDSSAGQCGFESGGDSNDIVGEPAGLGSLELNDGNGGTADVAPGIPYPPTAIPQIGSPAIEGDSTPGCASDSAPLFTGSGVDELNNPRTSGDYCDIGAVQVSDSEIPGLAAAGVSHPDSETDTYSQGTIIAGNYDVPYQAPPSGPSTPTTTPAPTVTIVSGPDRVATSVAASQAEFPNGKAGAVVLARDDLFPDALVGVPFAVAKDAPLLLSDPASLSPETATEIQRVLPAGGTVYLLGLTDGLSANIESQVQTLGGLGYKTVRIGGVDRYATAIDIAEALGNPKTVFEADGTDFPDALAAASPAVLDKGAILLTDGSTQDPETAAYLATLDPTTKYALGGPAAAADPSATAIVGTDRYATAAMAAARFFPAATGLGVATGLDFPDALTGGTLEAAAGNPTILVDPSYTSASALPAPLASYLTSLKGTLKSVTVFGGTAAVPTAVIQTIEAEVG